MVRRVEDWFRQAERDLAHARHAAEKAEYEWACFAAQQAAEKALKALFQALGGEGYGHSLTRLLDALPSEYRADEALAERARQLDKLYIPTRYPNGFDQGAPMDYFTVNDARRAIEDAEAILAFVRGKLSR